MTITEELDQFIQDNGGNARDALNVALARLKLSQDREKYLDQEVIRLRSEVADHESRWQDLAENYHVG